MRNPSDELLARQGWCLSVIWWVVIEYTTSRNTFLKEGGWTLGGINPKRGGWCRNGGGGGATFWLLYSSITFTACVGKVRFPYYFSDLQSFELAMQVSHPSLYCKFLIHSGSLQKKLTALFNFVWNTQKIRWTIFLSAQARCFLVLKRFLKR